MKRKAIIGSILALFVVVFAYISFQQIQPQEIENEPDWLTLNEAFDKSAVDERLILIDIYEVGCRFCREMAREVYPSETVRAVIDRSYNPVKLNGNSDDMIIYRGREMSKKEFAAEMGVSAFPFTVIMDPEGNVIDRRRGFMDIQGLARFLRNSENRDV
jgi:thioredoxin-related protein